MYYQQPLGYQIAQRTMYGAHFQNQQFRNQRVAALPSMLPYGKIQIIMQISCKEVSY